MQISIFPEVYVIIITEYDSIVIGKLHEILPFPQSLMLRDSDII